MTRSDARPVVQRIADDLREQITSGRLRPGDLLPSTRALCEQWGVYDRTVFDAVGLLRSEGLVASRRGRGVWVRDRLVLPYFAGDASAAAAADEDTAGWDLFAGAARARGRTPRRAVGHHRRLASSLPVDVTARLGVPPDALLIVQGEDWHVNGELWASRLAYSPTAPDAGGELATLDAVHDVVPAGVRDEWRVRPATRDEAESFQLVAGSGDKILTRTRTYAGRVDGELRVTRVVRDLLPDDRNAVIYASGDADALRLLDQLDQATASAEQAAPAAGPPAGAA